MHAKQNRKISCCQKNAEGGFKPDANVLPPSVVICSKGRLLSSPLSGGKESEINININFITELKVSSCYLICKKIHLAL